MRPVEELPYIEFEPDSGGTVRIYADTWMREDFSAPATVTMHAVENGSKISDHVRPDPIAFKLTLGFSDTPVRGDLDPDYPGNVQKVGLDIPDYPKQSLASPRGLVLAAEKLVGLGGQPNVPRSASALVFDKDPTGRVERVYRQLLDLRKQRKLLTVSTTIDKFDQMAMRDCQLTRQSSDGGYGEIVLDLVQIEFASSDVAMALPLPVEPRAQKPKDANSGGAQQVPAQKKTAAKALFDSVTK